MDSAERTWSQSGEDCILRALFSLFADRAALSYVDIGAAFPDSHNNSYFAYMQGGTGVLVEADASYLDRYKALRPNDIHVNAAVVPQRLRADGGVSFHLMDDAGWSTASAEHLQVAAVLGKGSPKATVVVPCLTINELLTRHGPHPLDFISIDIEGLDKEVLAELDADRFDPKAILAENEGGVPTHRAIMEAKGYEIYAYTHINTIYIRRRHFRL